MCIYIYIHIYIHVYVFVYAFCSTYENGFDCVLVAWVLDPFCNPLVVERLTYFLGPGSSAASHRLCFYGPWRAQILSQRGVEDEGATQRAWLDHLPAKLASQIAQSRSYSYTLGPNLGIVYIL